MRAQVKSILTAVAVVCMVVAGLGLSAAAILDNGKQKVGTSKLDAPENGWYHLSVIDDEVDPDLASNLEIGAFESSSPPVFDDQNCAQQDNGGSRCMIYLEFTELATEVPETVADVNATYESITNEARSPEE